MKELTDDYIRTLIDSSIGNTSNDLKIMLAQEIARSIRVKNDHGVEALNVALILKRIMNNAEISQYLIYDHISDSLYNKILVLHGDSVRLSSDIIKKQLITIKNSN